MYTQTYTYHFFFFALSSYCRLFISQALVLPILLFYSFITLIMYFPPIAHAYRSKIKKKKEKT